MTFTLHALQTLIRLDGNLGIWIARRHTFQSGTRFCPILHFIIGIANLEFGALQLPTIFKMAENFLKLF